VTHRIVALQSLPVLQQDAATGRMVETLDPTTGKPLTKQYVLTQGDANPAPDPDAAPYTSVRGVVLHVYHEWGWALQWAGSAVGRLAMLAPPLIALAVMEVLAVAEGRRARRMRPGLSSERLASRRAVDDLLLR
jgi:signal peptidase